MEKTHEIYKSDFGTYYLRFSLLGYRVHETTKTKEYRKALARLQEKKTQIVLADMYKSTFPIREIYQDYNGTYWLRFIHHDEIVHESTKTKNFARALEIFESKKSQKDKLLETHGSGNVSPNIKLRQAIIKARETYLCELRSSRDMIYRLNNILDILGSIRLKDIHKAHFVKIREALQVKGLAPSGINAYSFSLNKLLKIAREDWGVPCAKVSGIKLSVPKANIRLISQKEHDFIKRWLASPEAVKGTRSKWSNIDLLEIYNTFMLTGMRRTELFSFTVRQVEGNHINLFPDQHKTGDRVGNRVIVLNSKVQQIIYERIKRLKLKEADRVFPFHAPQYSRLWNRMCHRMDIPASERFTLHCTRHTFAYNLIKAGATIYEISRLLGHTTVKTTEMYSHLFTDDLAEVAELLLHPIRRKRGGGIVL